MVILDWTKQQRYTVLKQLFICSSEDDHDLFKINLEKNKEHLND